MAVPRLGLRAVRLSEVSFAWLLVAPAVLAIVVVVALPLAYSLWLSFTDVNLLRTSGAAIEMFGMRLPLYRWVGLKNYLQVRSEERRVGKECRL